MGTQLSITSNKKKVFEILTLSLHPCSSVSSHWAVSSKKTFPCPPIIRRTAMKTKMNLIKPRKAQRKLIIGDLADQGLGSSVGDVVGCLLCGLIALIPALGRLM